MKPRSKPAITTAVGLPRKPQAEPKPRKPEARSRVTNGAELIPGADGRSLWVRRCRDILELHIADLGGDAAISEAERSIVRRAAVIATELERLEQKFALSGEASTPDLDSYQRGANSLRRLLEAVGLKRRTADITSPNLETYLRTKHRNVAAEDEAIA